MPRLFQILIALFALLVLSPIMLIIILLLIHPGAVFYTQLRTGKDNTPFLLYKFKTMISAREPENPHGSELITPLGGILRRFSLDELPQLWNVLRGEMNLVGPRPLPVDYLPRMDEPTRIRYKVRPGITGWTQVKGRNALSWQKKFEMDRWYVENRSALLDLKILFMTLPAVFSKKGINQDEFVTMEEFTGNESPK